MASQANWELDPETRTKLAALQKKDGAGNDRCCDCGAPSPQWASPKFAVFICLQCAGIHRGLGVHISFVRSISMDAFKQTEIKRMQLGGNKTWQDFFNKNSTASSFEESTIKERYECEVGEEYKERLSAKVEDRTFDKPQFLRDRAVILEKQAEKSRNSTPAGVGRKALGSAGGSRTASPAPGSMLKSGPGMDPAQKSKNESYFARMGEANSSRPESLPPSQGGKYGGFGSSVEPSSSSAAQHNSTSSIPTADEFQKDPVAALTRGLGWFTTTVGRQAKTLNESYLQPTAANLASTDLASQARNLGATVGQGLQTGARGAASQFHKFVEGQDEAAGNAAATRQGGSSGARVGGGRGQAEPERKDFWDSFGVDNSDKSKPATGSRNPSNSIGTNAMKSKTNVTGISGTTTATTKSSASQDNNKNKKKDDGWGDDW